LLSRSRLVPQADLRPVPRLLLAVLRADDVLLYVADRSTAYLPDALDPAADDPGGTRTCWPVSASHTLTPGSAD
jgi:hypothetical protein